MSAPENPVLIADTAARWSDHNPLRDDPMDPLSERDRHAAAMLKLFRERIPGYGDGRGSPKEMARLAAEYLLTVVQHNDGGGADD